MITALFFGSRQWADAATIDAALERLILEGDGALQVVTGAAGLPADDRYPERSADALADWLARDHGFTPIRVPADWAHCDPDHPTVPCRHGAQRVSGSGRPYCPSAGVRRNQAMIDLHLAPRVAEGVTVVARGFRCPGASTGTDDMLGRLKAAGIPGLLKKGGLEPTAPPSRRRWAPTGAFEPFPEVP